MDTTICCPNGHPLSPGSTGERPTCCPVCGVPLAPTSSGSPRVSPNDATEILPTGPLPMTASKTQVPLGSDTQVLDKSPAAVPTEGAPRPVPPDARTEEISRNEAEATGQDDADQVDESEPPLEPQYGFAGVYYGLVWHYYKVAALLLVMLLVAVAVALHLYRETQPPDWIRLTAETAEWVVTLAAFLLVVAAPVLGLVGSIRCLTVPREARSSRSMIGGATVLEVLGLALLLIAVAGSLRLISVTPVPEGDSSKPNGIFGLVAWVVDHALILALLANLGAMSFFLLFAEQLNRYFRDRTSAAEAFALLGRAWAVAAGWVIVGTLIALHAWLGENRHRFDPSIALGVGLFIVITLPLALWASIWVLRGILDLIGSLRHLIWIKTT